MKYLPIDNQLFINNRKEFSVKLATNTIAIFNANDVMPTNADGTMPFRQNNDLFWLSEEKIYIGQRRCGYFGGLFCIYYIFFLSNANLFS